MEQSGRKESLLKTRNMIAFEIKQTWPLIKLGIRKTDSPGTSRHKARRVRETWEEQTTCSLSHGNWELREASGREETMTEMRPFHWTISWKRIQEERSARTLFVKLAVGNYTEEAKDTRKKLSLLGGSSKMLLWAVKFQWLRFTFPSLWVPSLLVPQWVLFTWSCCCKCCFLVFSF